VAEEKKEAVEEAPKKSGGLNIALLATIGNTVVIALALVTAVYAKMIYHRPEITEHGERERLEALAQAKDPSQTASITHYDAMTVNIKPEPTNPKHAPGTQSQIAGKLHYLTFAFSAEIRDAEDQPLLDDVRAKFLDGILARIGKTSYKDLNSVQGRYLLRASIIELANNMLNKPVIKNVFFTQFVVQ
jgi:flagellar protein FliL